MRAANVLCLLVATSLSGCYIGPGGICGPQTPIYYCQSKVDQENMRPRPYGAHWVKEGMTKERRKEDFVACGGGADMRQGYDIQPNQSTSEFFKIFNAHVTEVAACMRSKAYSYQEVCDARCMYP